MNLKNELIPKKLKFQLDFLNEIHKKILEKKAVKSVQKVYM
jgi:hypothetical protein